METNAMIASPPPIAPLAVTINDAVRFSGIGRTRLYKAIGDRELTPVKVGKRTLILFDDLQTWLRQHRVSTEVA
jgi:excisionase family DNA binding protein